MIENTNNRIIDANVKLQDENKLLKEDKEILKRRMNRAIEYCEFGIENWITDDGFVEEVLGDVKKILKGEYVKEEK